MKNISFDNPYWLLLAIPLLLLLFIPYFIAKSKDNKSRSWTASLIIHLIIIISVTLAAAGMIHTTVMTRTKVYIVADVSYSANRNLDKIDEYIQQVNDSLPPNSRLGIVCFGKDPEILTSSGTAIRSVKEYTVDDTATDIAGALDFTADLFSEGELKRIILITDGFDTTMDGSAAAAVERVIAKDIKIDAIYLDNNLKDGEAEVQISDVKFTPATYLNHKTSLSVLVESSVENLSRLDLYVKSAESGQYTQIDSAVIKTEVGMSLVNFTLPTNIAGIFDYKVEISAPSDTSPYNNSYVFSQSVANKRQVMLVTELRSDINGFSSLYGDMADLDTYLINESSSNIPYTVEQLSKYDEIILSNVDIRKINNINAFIDSADVVVSQYGKTLITYGDLCMQNRDDEVFVKLEELLPVSFGNASKDSKLYTIVIDISRSMYSTRPAKLIAAKDAATKLASILDDDDHICLITLAGEARVALAPQRLGDCREELYKEIQNVNPTQGTLVGEAINLAYETVSGLDFEEKQVMLISDGKTYQSEPNNATVLAEKMNNDGITLSTVAVILNLSSKGDLQGAANLETLANIGGGLSYILRDENEVSELVFATIGNDITESVIEGRTPVNIESFDSSLEGIVSLPDVFGYINSKIKPDAKMVLSVDYVKNSSTTVHVPLYSYRYHGNGRVATFNSSVFSSWLREWDGGDVEKFFGNVLMTNTPDQRVDYPYEITFEHHGSNSTVEIVPSKLEPTAKVKIKITSPTGKVTEQQLVFNLNKYSTSFATSEIGKYHIEIVYSYGNHTFPSDTYYSVPYGREYDAFAVYDMANIYDFMRGAGSVSTDGVLNLENEKGDVATYELNFRIPLLILAVSLFVADVFIRKFKWKDIKGFFHKKEKKGVK